MEAQARDEKGHLRPRDGKLTLIVVEHLAEGEYLYAKHPFLAFLPGLHQCILVERARAHHSGLPSQQWPMKQRESGSASSMLPFTARSRAHPTAKDSMISPQVTIRSPFK
jgi:hypothetical protein